MNRPRFQLISYTQHWTLVDGEFCRDAIVRDLRTGVLLTMPIVGAP